MPRQAHASQVFPIVCDAWTAVDQDDDSTSAPTLVNCERHDWLTIFGATPATFTDVTTYVWGQMRDGSVIEIRSYRKVWTVSDIQEVSVRAFVGVSAVFAAHTGATGTWSFGSILS